MDILHRLEHWGDTHHPRWLDVIRISLGVFLCYKGIDFLQNTSTITGPLSNKTSFGSFTVILLGHYVVFAHLVGGILMVAGLYTRVACIIQIPILMGAVLFIQSARDVFEPYSDLAITVIVLLLLFYFLIVGNGPWAIKIEDEKQRLH